MAQLQPGLAKPLKPRIHAIRFRIGTAPRAWCSVHGRSVFFTEKSPPPRRFRPGSVYRVIYRITADSSAVRRLLPLGDVSEDPVVDGERGVIYALRRLKDTNGDGTVDRNDSATLWKLDTRNRKAVMLPLPAVPLAVSPVDGTLIGRYGQDLYRFTPGENPPARLSGTPKNLRRIRFDTENTLYLLDRKGRAFRLKGERFIRTDDLGINDTGAKTRIVGGVPSLLFPGKNTRPFPLIADGAEWIWMLGLDAATHLFFYHGSGCALIAVNPDRGGWLPLYRFPRNCTRFFIDRGGRSVVWLSTSDTDKNGKLNPASLDKSSLSLVQIR